MKKHLKHKLHLKTHIIRRGSDEIYVTDSLVNYWFTIINRAVFDNRLPRPTFIIVDTANFTSKYLGMCISDGEDSAIIKISSLIKDRKTLISIIAHEMVHLSQWIDNQDMGHGVDYIEWKKFFKKHYNLNL